MLSLDVPPPTNEVDHFSQSINAPRQLIIKIPVACSDIRRKETAFPQNRIKLCNFGTLFGRGVIGKK